MEDIKQHLSDISEMRSIMERNTRFLSLSGMAGIAAGVFALLGAGAAYWVIRTSGRLRLSYEGLVNSFTSGILFKLSLIAAIVLVCALASAYYFTHKKAKRNNDRLFSGVAKRMLFSTAIPLATGGLFSLVLMYHHLYVLVAPCLLIFYGLACVSASQYTHTEVRYIGLLNILLGLISCFFLGYGLFFWALGFGVLHILYGALMYKRHDRPKSA